MFDVDRLIALLKNKDIIEENDLRLLCEKVKEILVEESNVQPITSPVIVCGDIHG